MPADAAASSQSVSDLQQRIEALDAELRASAAERDEARARETALAEVLQAINASTGDFGPVFTLILDKAVTLCDAPGGGLVTVEGDYATALAFRNTPQVLVDYWSSPQYIDPCSSMAQALRQGRTLHVPDMANSEPYRKGLPMPVSGVKLGGIRSAIMVPLLNERGVIGLFVIYRREVRPFTERQIAVVEAFAAQALVAMQNARLLADQREALEQQTATAEVLQVINSSPGDLAPVFDAMLEKAMRLCGAVFGDLRTYDGERFYPVAARGVPDAYVEYYRGHGVSYGPGTGPASILSGERVVHIPDLIDTEAYRRGDPDRRALVDLGKARASLLVPLLKDAEVAGFIMIYRQEARAFSDKQIKLLQNFAAQAVIAMENARLLGELRQRTDDLTESLEYQTATSELLEVISRSTADVQPVLDTMLASAARLCGTTSGGVAIRQGDVFRYLAGIGLNVAFEDLIRAHAYRMDRTTTIGRVALSKSVVHIADAKADPDYQSVTSDAGGIRTLLGVPLLREDDVIGVIVLVRDHVEPFTDRQIALVKTFADQAVIAMENARLITEQRESLDRQTALADVLKAINSSRDDLVPVFQTILEKAHGLCGAEFGSLQTWDGEKFQAVVVHNLSPALEERLKRGYIPGPNSPGRGLIAGQSVVHIRDIEGIDDPVGRVIMENDRLRTLVHVALRKDQTLLGQIVAARPEVRAFTDKEIALLENFAAQAVIAIENARLLGELRQRTDDLTESLEYQTATSELLEVISRSATDIQPVMDTILAAAARLCGTTSGAVAIRRDSAVRIMAVMGVVPEVEAALRERNHTDHSTMTGRTVLAGRVIHVDDVAADAEYSMPEIVRVAQMRTVLGVPLLRDGEAVGAIVVSRSHVERFTERQIALIRTFADQAVIAMENARLLSELRESLDQQTAMAEVLQVISRSPGEVQPVFDAILESATRICDAEFGALGLRAEAGFDVLADRNLPAAFAQYLKDNNPLPILAGSMQERMVQTREVMHLTDLPKDDGPTSQSIQRRALVELAGARTMLWVPMVKDKEVVGQIGIFRTEVAPFSEQQIELVKNFASQAVIAIENARLLGEVRRREQELSVTFEHMGDGVLMLDAELRLAAWNRNFQRLLDVPDAFLATRPILDDYIRLLVERGEVGEGNVEKEIARYRTRAGRPWSTERIRADGRVIEVRSNPIPSGGSVVIYSDITRRKKAEAEVAAARDAAEAALERQTAIADILKVIASSPTDVRPVLDVVAASAARFCGATDALISLLEGDDSVALAHYGPLTYEPAVRRSIARNSISSHAVTDAVTIHVPDTYELDPVEYARAIAQSNEHKFRAALAAPMLREGRAIGLILLRKPEVGAFTTQQIELAETFAAQAVIAIENVRLFTELRESLDQQTATSEILRAISQSPTDVQPVLKAVAKAAVRFCAATDAVINLREGSEAVSAAHEGPLGAVLGRRAALDGETASSAAILERRTIHLPDIDEIDGAKFGETRARAAEFGFQAVISAPLMREDTAVGAISLRRIEPGPFTDQQIELLETFAAQAVIAIENVRLFTELRESLERLKAAQANLIQSEKMASLGQLTAGIAHEIKNPLNFVNNFAGLSSELVEELKQTVDALLAEPAEDKRADLQDTMDLLTGNLAKIVEHGRRADGIVKSMLAHSRGGTGDWQSSNINSLVEEALNLAYHGARAQDQNFNVTLERDLGETLKPIDVVPQDITRVFLNLSSNGFYATRKRQREGGNSDYWPTLRISTRELGEAVEIRVRDNGTGISAEVREKLYQPFFTTKPTGEGTGLGLSISYDIVTQQHGGSIEVESEVGQFTEFTVRLPRARRAAA